MKYREGYVSNSSSSSFVLDTTLLTSDMMDKIFNHIQVAQREYEKMGISNKQTGYFGYAEDEDAWNVEHIDKNKMAVYTHMTNFDMEYFFEFIKVPKEAIIEEGDGWKYYF